MEPHTFNAKVISGHRLTIRNDIVEELGLVEGDKVRVTVQRTGNIMRENSVVTEALK